MIQQGLEQKEAIYRSNLRYDHLPKLVLIIFMWISDLIILIAIPAAFIVEIFIERNYLFLITIPILGFALFLIHGKLVTWMPENFEIYEDRVVIYKRWFTLPWKTTPFTAEIKDIEFGVLKEASLFLKTTNGVYVADMMSFDKNRAKKLAEAVDVLRRKNIEFISKEEYDRIFTNMFRDNIRRNANMNKIRNK